MSNKDYCFVDEFAANKFNDDAIRNTLRDNYKV
jgi:hypothetical protein